MDPLLSIAVDNFLSYRVVSFSDKSEYITTFTPTAVFFFFFFYFAEQLMKSTSSSGPGMYITLNLSLLFLQPADAVFILKCQSEYLSS